MFQDRRCPRLFCTIYVYHLNSSRLKNDLDNNHLNPSLDRDSVAFCPLTDDNKKHIQKYQDRRPGIINHLEVNEPSFSKKNLCPIDFGIGANSKLEWLQRYVNTIFDLDICKVIYDPKTERLYIYNIEMFWTMSCVYDRSFATEKRLTRKRTQSYLNALTAINANFDNRLQKYKDRGFTLTPIQK